MQIQKQPKCHYVNVECSCGEKFVTETIMSVKDIKLNICNKCHPFFTGQQKFVDNDGRVEKFKKKYNV